MSSNEEFDQDMDYLTRQQRIYAKILIEPKTKSRFRYPCEGRSAGSILGANTSASKKTYPSIMVYGLSEDKKVVEVMVTCLMKTSLKTHPHKLVGLNCENGICRFKVELCKENSAIVFKQMGIQCVKRTQIVASLDLRQAIGVDPFNMGFSHKKEAKSIDLSTVRLCFQVSMLNERGQVEQVLEPVVSEVIHDKKSVSDLEVKRISVCSGSVRGETTVILLCEKVTLQNTKVIFFKDERGERVWEAEAHILDLHKQVAITFQTPPYCNTEITNPVMVFLQLVRRSDNAFGDPRSFEYFPDIDKTTPKPWKVHDCDNYARTTPLHSMANPSIQGFDSQSWERTDSISSHNTECTTVDTLLSPDLMSPGTHPEPLFSHNQSDTLYTQSISSDSKLRSPYSSFNQPGPWHNQIGHGYSYTPPDAFNIQPGASCIQPRASYTQPGFLHNQPELPYTQTRPSDYETRPSNTKTDSLYPQTYFSLHQAHSSFTPPDFLLHQSDPSLTQPGPSFIQPGCSFPLPNSSITQSSSSLTQTCSSLTKPCSSFALENSSSTQTGYSFPQSVSLFDQHVSSGIPPSSWLTKPDSTLTQPGSSQTQPGATHTQTRVPYQELRSLNPQSTLQGTEPHLGSSVTQQSFSYTHPGSLDNLSTFSEIQPARLSPQYQDLDDFLRELDPLNVPQDPVQRTEQNCDGSLSSLLFGL